MSPDRAVALANHLRVRTGELSAAGFSMAALDDQADGLVAWLAEAGLEPAAEDDGSLLIGPCDPDRLTGGGVMLGECDPDSEAGDELLAVVARFVDPNPTFWVYWNEGSGRLWVELFAEGAHRCVPAIVATAVTAAAVATARRLVDAVQHDPRWQSTAPDAVSNVLASASDSLAGALAGFDADTTA